jgi:hypothetical protein
MTGRRHDKTAALLLPAARCILSRVLLSIPFGDSPHPILSRCAKPSASRSGFFLASWR